MGGYQPAHMVAFDPDVVAADDGTGGGLDHRGELDAMARASLPEVPRLRGPAVTRPPQDPIPAVHRQDTGQAQPPTLPAKVLMALRSWLDQPDWAAS
jgi:hypothetical protein